VGDRQWAIGDRKSVDVKMSGWVNGEERDEGAKEVKSRVVGLFIS